MLILDLCMALGKTQKEILDHETGLDQQDILEWMAYQRIKPFGYDEERRRFGMVCSSISNSAGKVCSEDTEWSDYFMPSWEDSEKKSHTSKFSPDSLVKILASVAVKAEPKDVKKENNG